MILEDLSPVSAPLPWQAGQWQEIHNALQQGQLPHALMLSGSAGVGKDRFALALARLLLCHRSEAGTNCGSCKACELSRNETHGDLRWLQPEGTSRVIKIDQVRSALAFCQKTASFGERKVLVIAPADTLNVNAANALLKCLEEPSPDTHIILVCQRPHSIPATVRSRCQQLAFPLPDATAATQWLAQIVGDNQGAGASDFLELAGGRPLLAEALFLTDGGAALNARGTVLAELASGTVSASEASAVFADASLEEMTRFMIEQLEQRLRQAAKDSAQGKADRGAERAMFALLDELRKGQAAVVSGVNPSRDLYLQTTLGRWQSVLGHA
ncbi:MAG: DNA polymerase III subunit delta' [Halioglobus sp.]